jgi:hypothetical protein
MKNQCRIDARNNHAKNMENDANMEPKWRSNPSKKLYKKTSRKMMQKLSAKKLYARRGRWAWSVRRGKEFLRRLQVKVPSCIQHPAKKTNTLQTTKKQPRTPNPTRTHLACRQARCGSINILGPRAPQARSLSPPQRGPRHRLHHSTGTYSSHCFPEAFFLFVFNFERLLVVISTLFHSLFC